MMGFRLFLGFWFRCFTKSLRPVVFAAFFAAFVLLPTAIVLTRPPEMELRSSRSNVAAHAPIQEDELSTTLRAMQAKGVRPQRVSTTFQEIKSDAKYDAKTNDVFTFSHLNGTVGGKFLVPNFVHYIWFNGEKYSKMSFGFLHYVCFLSVQRFLKPEAIFVHGNALPVGDWWRRTVEDVENIYFVNTTVPLTAPSGETFRFIEHAADVTKLRTLIEYGGIYLDTDSIVLKSFDPLRRYPVVLGRDAPDALSNGIILAQKDSPFLRLWLNEYNAYKDKLAKAWRQSGLIVPNNLHKQHPELGVHVEEKSMFLPSWTIDGNRELYIGSFNWTNSYSLHVWKRGQLASEKLPRKPEDIRTGNATIHNVMRYVCYGSPDAVAAAAATDLPVEVNGKTRMRSFC